MGNHILNSVSSITEGDAEGTYYWVECNVSFPDPDTGEMVIGEDVVHCQRIGETEGFAPLITQWMVDNPTFPITPYTAPVFTPEQLREWMPKLTPRQFWLAARTVGVTKDGILTTIDSTITDPAEREAIKIEVTETMQYTRTDPLVSDLATLMGVTEVELDSLWQWAATL